MAVCRALGATLFAFSILFSFRADAARGHMGAEALTDFPINVGGKLWGELPYGVRLSTSLGYLPGAYVDAINATLVAASVYDRTTADLLRTSLTSSFVFRLHAGIRPFARRGFYIEAGYGLTALGGGFTPQALLTMATGYQVAAPEEYAGKQYAVRSLLHMVDAEVGWHWVIAKGFSVRAALGFAGTANAQSQIRPADNSPMGEEETMLAKAGESLLNQVYTRYVFTPTATLAAGWRFF